MLKKAFNNQQLKLTAKLMNVEESKKLIHSILTLARDLPRHNPIYYINRNVLTEKFYQDAERTLGNGYLYIILSNTGSSASEAIAKLTKKEYSHASLCFDPELSTIISYNGGQNITPPGLNYEELRYLNQKTDASAAIYRIKATRKQKHRVLEEIRKIDREGSSYNILGLFLPYTPRENIMFCSQFVYRMLKVAKLNYFKKKPEKILPTDFIELDSEGNLELVAKFLIKEILERDTAS